MHDEKLHNLYSSMVGLSSQGLWYGMDV